MKLASVIGYACDQIAPIVIATASSGLTLQTGEPVQYETQDVRYSDILPRGSRAKNAQSVLSIIERAIEEAGYNVTVNTDCQPMLESWQFPYATIKKNGHSFAIVTSDIRSLSEHWSQITTIARDIAKRQDLEGDHRSPRGV